MNDEDDLVMISALQHYMFCPRQCALIHIEQQWQENRLTAEGRILHERVHTSGRESRRKHRVEYDVPIRSLRLGITGRADIVEFALDDNNIWQPTPVEYKRGRPKKDDTDRVQLCAQTICLEEMLDRTIATGFLYYGEKKRRTEVEFSQELRDTTARTAEAVHVLLASGRTPPPHYFPRCKSCSFISVCLPKIATRKRVDRYLQRQVEE